LKYAWVDTCCIDKKSSAELQEAINSMFRWYKSAAVCYAYLSDIRSISDAHHLCRSKWFTRGWTLQELVAPRRFVFFSSPWKKLGPRYDFATEIAMSSRIPVHILQQGLRSLEQDRILIAQVMNWAKDRQTTRVEDRAYSLLGIFDVFMPMLYGEGERAFQRLQEELIRKSNDQSIFAWTGLASSHGGILAGSSQGGILASSPENFASVLQLAQYEDIERRRPASVTSEGVEIEVTLTTWAPGVYLALFNFRLHNVANPYLRQCGIFLQRLDKENRYARIVHLKRELHMLDLRSAYNGRSEVRMLTIVHALQQNEMAGMRSLRDPENFNQVMLTIKSNLRSGDNLPMLHLREKGPYKINERVEIPMYVGEVGVMSRIHVDHSDLDFGQLKGLTIGIDEEFNVIMILSSRKWPKHDPYRVIWIENDSHKGMDLHPEKPWICVPHQSSKDRFLYPQSSEVFGIASASQYSGDALSSLWVKPLSETDLAVKIDQSGQRWKCSFVVNAKYEDPVDPLAQKMLPCFTFDMGYPTHITLRRYQNLRPSGRSRRTSIARRLSQQSDMSEAGSSAGASRAVWSDVT
jgi:hypothetical protein